MVLLSQHILTCFRDIFETFSRQCHSHLVRISFASRSHRGRFRRMTVPTKVSNHKSKASYWHTLWHFAILVPVLKQHHVNKVQNKTRNSNIVSMNRTTSFVHHKQKTTPRAYITLRADSLLKKLNVIPLEYLYLQVYYPPKHRRGCKAILRLVLNKISSSWYDLPIGFGRMEGFHHRKPTP